MSRTTFHDRAELEADQLSQLRRLVAALRESNPFYGPRLEQAGLDDTLASLDQFTSSMPFTLKTELTADQEQHPPYGSNLTYPIDQYIRLHQTSSTTGKPLRWLDTNESWSWMVDGWVDVLEASGVTAQDRLFAAFSFGPFIGFWMGFEAAQRIGCLTIPGGAMNSITRLRAILANEVTVLCCTPTYANRLGEVAREEGIDLSRSCVRTIVVGGEPGGSLPATRERIETLWPDAKVYDHHGMTEIGPATYQCPQRIGALHLIESSLLCELIHPETGKPLPADSQDMAELVVTTLGRTGSPLLRYRTGDLVRAEPAGTCICGRIERTFIGGIIGRADDMIYVRGVNLYPSAVDQIIRTVPGIAEYRVEISEDRGMTELKVLLEPAPGINNASELQDKVSETFRSTYNLRVPIEIVGADTLPRFELKARRWVRQASEVTA